MTWHYIFTKSPARSNNINDLRPTEGPSLLKISLTALELERSEGAVIADRVGDTACMFLAGLYRAEQAIADRLIRIVNGRLPWAWVDEEKAIPWVERRSGLQLADSQRAAIRLALMAKALVITGGPGVGKTTIVNSILKIPRGQRRALIALRPHGPRSPNA